MSRPDGIFLPVHDGKGIIAPVEVAWLSTDMVAVGQATAAQPLLTDALDEGLYDIWVAGAAWVNAASAQESAPNTDPAITNATAAKAHDGGHWVVALRDGERIAVRARGSSAIEVRIHRVA